MNHCQLNEISIYPTREVTKVPLIISRQWYIEEGDHSDWGFQKPNLLLVSLGKSVMRFENEKSIIVQNLLTVTVITVTPSNKLWQAHVHLKLE